MKSKKPPASPMSEEEIGQIAVNLMLGMRASINWKVVQPLEGWSRLRTALEAAAASSLSWSGLVSMMADQLQIVAPGPRTASSIFSLASIFEKHPALFERFRRYCEKEAFYVACIAQDTNARTKASLDAMRSDDDE